MEIRLQIPLAVTDSRAVVHMCERITLAASTAGSSIEDVEAYGSMRSALCDLLQGKEAAFDAAYFESSKRALRGE